MTNTKMKRWHALGAEDWSALRYELPGVGTRYIKEVGMPVENFEIDP